MTFWFASLIRGVLHLWPSSMESAREYVRTKTRIFSDSRTNNFCLWSLCRMELDLIHFWNLPWKWSCSQDSLRGRVHAAEARSSRINAECNKDWNLLATHFTKTKRQLEETFVTFRFFGKGVFGFCGTLNATITKLCVNHRMAETVRPTDRTHKTNVAHIQLCASRSIWSFGGESPKVTLQH